MITTIPPKGPSIFISYDSTPNLLEVYLTGKVYSKFEDIINGSLGVHYVFANVNEDVDTIAKRFLEETK